MTREQLIEAIRWHVARQATCPKLAATVIRTLSVAVILTGVGGVANAQLARVPIYTGPVRSTSTGGVLTGVPVPQGGVIIIGTYGVGRAYRAPLPGARLNRAMRRSSAAPRDHRSHLDDHRDYVTECHERSADRLDAEEVANDTAFNSTFDP